MKYEKPEISIKLFKLENVVTTSVLGEVGGDLTGNSNTLSLDGKSNINANNLFVVEWTF